MNAHMEKLLSPSRYGPEEYTVVCLVIFIFFVALKHLFFHTLYHWWYGQGRLYIPQKLHDLISGKSLPQRIFLSTKKGIGNKNSSDSILEEIECYCEDKEFALTIGKEKGEKTELVLCTTFTVSCCPAGSVLDKIVTDRRPHKVLVSGSLCGYAVLRILKHCPEESHVYVVEPDESKASSTNQFCSLAGWEKQVTVLNTDVATAVPVLKNEYGVKKLDFIFLTSTQLTKPHYLDELKLFEESHFLHEREENQESPHTVILADKVVHFEENEFLKYVRNSTEYETEYHQMALEYSPNEIVDGMEKATYVGKL